MSRKLTPLEIENLIKLLKNRLNELGRYTHKKQITKRIMIKELFKNQTEYVDFTEYEKTMNKEKATLLLNKLLDLGADLELLKFQEWLETSYQIEKFRDMKKEHVLEYCLIYQITSIRKNQYAYHTKQIYRKGALSVVKFVAHKYRMTDYRKLENKHIKAYIAAESNRGIKPLTIQKKLYGAYYYYKILFGINHLTPIKEVMKDV